LELWKREARSLPSLTVENYVKTIYSIGSREGSDRTVATGELAQALAVSPGTVTGMLKTLAEAGLATYTPYEGARLTPGGRRLALMVLRRHRLLELFLAKTLSLTWDEVHEEAEHMEHAVSERLVDRIEQLLGHPTVDPHGDPIPSADGMLKEPEGKPLAGLEAGLSFRVVRVVDQDPAFLRYLTESGLQLGSSGQLIDNRPEAGAISVRVNGRTLALGVDAARRVLVESSTEGFQS
jgi:DtxR family transcriptional regulator, Mn-dependent transcriptional regulator